MNYYDLLELLQAEIAPKTYLEIGVRFGKSLALAPPGSLAIGIDPQVDLRYDVGHLESRTFAMTSDDFFAGGSAHATLAGRTIDLAFIDGMHHFEAALRDFVNIERFCGPASVILLHDTLPRNRRCAARLQSTRLWSGDVWKTVVALRRYRADLRVTTFDILPTGLTMVTNLRPMASFLPDRLSTIVEELSTLDYEYLVDNMQGCLNVVPSRGSTICGLLPSAVDPAGPKWTRRARRKWILKAVLSRALKIQRLRSVYWSIRDCVSSRDESFRS